VTDISGKGGLGLGFILLDFTDGKGVQFAVVAEQDSINYRFALAEMPRYGPPQHHSNAR
jgi:hypothetical protein